MIIGAGAVGATYAFEAYEQRPCFRRLPLSTSTKSALKGEVMVSSNHGASFCPAGADLGRGIMQTAVKLILW